MTTPITVPRANANDDVVLLVEWLGTAGTRVRAGQGLYVVETSKATEEIGAEGEGFVRPVVKVGQMVAVGQVIGFLTATAEEVVPEGGGVGMGSAVSLGGAGGATTGGTPVLRGEVKITAQGLALAESLGIDWKGLAVPADGVIRAENVRAYQAGLAVEQPAGSAVARDELVGRMDAEFLALVRAGPQAIAGLSSEAKVELYRQHGAVIGAGVSIGAGTRIEAEYICLGAETVLAENVLIRGRRFAMGELGEIGAGAKILCRDFVAGAGVNIRFRAVIVQGGGMHSCRIGDDSFIAYDTYINTDRDVTIGRHVCLAPGVRIYTHRKWLSPLEGYGSGFAAVAIGEDCHLGPNVVVLPGVTIGPRVTVMANAVVAGNIGAERLIGGAPAKTIVEGAMYHKPLDAGQRQAALVQILRECLLSFEGWGAVASNVVMDGAGRGASFDLSWQGQTAAILYMPGKPGVAAGTGRSVVLSFDSAVLALASDRVTAFDLAGMQVRGARDALSDFFRSQLDFYGLHFRPRQRRIPAPSYE